MMILLALPVLAFVALAQRYLQVYAPSNLFIRRIQTARARWLSVGCLALVIGLLLGALRLVELALGSGAPGWFNLVAVVLAWDSIKFTVMMVKTAARAALRPPRQGLLATS